MHGFPSIDNEHEKVGVCVQSEGGSTVPRKSVIEEENQL